jgi:UTP--glucose-1-phosphate uridylyltransferase
MDNKATVSKCLFPVGGLGTRFLPATKEIPKEMLPLIDRPLIHYGVREAVDSDCCDVIFITGRTKRSIEDYFDRSWELENLLLERHKDELYHTVRDISEMANFIYARQTVPLGLGHAVLCGEPFCRGEYFGVILPDDVMISSVPVLSQLINVHDRFGGSVVALEKVDREDVSRYGIVMVSEEVEPGIFRIIDLVEKPAIEEAPSELAIMGRYVLSPAIFDILRKSGKGAGGEYQLTDAMRELLKHEPLWGYTYEGRRFDCGTPKGWLYTSVALSLERPGFREVVLKALEENQ